MSKAPQKSRNNLFTNPITRWLLVIIVGYFINFIVYTSFSSTSYIIENISQNECVEVAFVVEGFPVREVISDQYRGECGSSKINIGYGDTLAGKLSFVSNWFFYSLIVYFIINRKSFLK